MDIPAYLPPRQTEVQSLMGEVWPRYFRAARDGDYSAITYATIILAFNACKAECPEYLLTISDLISQIRGLEGVKPSLKQSAIEWINRMK